MLDFSSSLSKRSEGNLQVSDSKPDEGFKVVDRRLFTEEGELRNDAVEQERRDEEAKEKSAAAAPPEVRSGAKRTNPSAAAGAGAPDVAADEHPPSHNFQMLVDFLTRNAAAMLGGMADPRTGQAFVDLEGARELIDMLDALRDTTRGNLAKSDEDLLIEVIGSLKLTFMEVSKAASEAMAKKAKGKA
jgi:Domain of unknown function (DUF1844)